MSLLAVDDLAKSFGGVVAARDVSFTVESGEMVALIGPNGAGKSTIFGMIGGQVRPDRGIVSLDGRAITHASPQERFRLGIGRTFQIAQAFHSMSVRENVQMALISHHHGSLALWHAAREQHREPASALLEQVGMSAFGDRPCSELAYGDVKRVELAIALAGGPETSAHGRAHRRNGAAGAQGPDGTHARHRADPPHRRVVYRARHGCGVRTRVSRAGSAAGRDHRGGKPGRDPCRPEGAAGLSWRRAPLWSPPDDRPSRHCRTCRRAMAARRSCSDFRFR